MSESISIQFKKGNELSVALFSQDDGPELIETARKYAIVLKAAFRNSSCWPLERLEPSTVMVDFIRHLAKQQRLEMVTSNYYLEKDETCGDMTAHGNHIIDFDAISLPADCTLSVPIVDLKEASGHLKASLKKAFPLVKFSVQTRIMSAGEEFIHVVCKDGVPENDIRKIAEKYQIILVNKRDRFTDIWYRRVLLNGKTLKRIKCEST
jgi:hypothetical protein